MSKINEKGVLIFYDWLDRLKEAQLEPEDALSVIYALADYSRYGENPVDKVDVSLKYAVGIMVDQIRRAEETAEQNKKNAQKRWKKNTSAEQQDVIRRNTANYGELPSDTDVIRRNTTNTNTDTDTNTNTPPYNPPEGITTTTTNNSSVKREVKLVEPLTDEERALFDRVWNAFVGVYGMDAAEFFSDFVAYNNMRGWIGSSGEDILIDDNTIKRYVKRWMRQEKRYDEPLLFPELGI